jgi:aldehyde:ferredoxin oxidoreductase
VEQLAELLRQREQAMDGDQAKIAELAERYNKQRDLGDVLAKRQQESEDNFRDKIAAFNQEIIQLKDLKMKAIDKLFSSVLQLKSGLEHLNELVAQADTTAYLKPFVAHFAKVCLAIEHELSL